MAAPNRVAIRDSVARELRALTDAEVRTLAGGVRRVGIGGQTGTVDVAGTPVFVKTIRLTDREVDAGSGDTRNLFDLPPWYHYGVGEGSTGFSAWREVAIHEMVSGWVAADQRSPFPLQYHWRVLPDTSLREFDEADIVRAVRFWKGSAEIETRLRSLSRATAVVAIFIEHVPNPLRDWLDGRWATGEEYFTSVADQLLRAATQLRAHGVLHFDAHLDNVLTTGEQLVVSDFGLATATTFDLDDAERRFVATHVDHDVAYCTAELVNEILRRSMVFPDARTRNDWVRRCAQTGSVEGLPVAFAESIRRLASTAALIDDFYWHLHDGDVESPFPAAALAAALGDLHR